MVTLCHFKISAEQLNSMPESERVALVLLCHAANELAVLGKMFHFCTNFEVDDEGVLADAQNTQSLLMGRLLTGKLYEFWKLLDKAYFCKDGPSKKYAQLLDPDAKDALDQIKKYFSGNNLIKTVRQKFAFHYSPDQIKNGFRQIVENDPLDVYLSSSNFNSLYAFAETIAGRSLLEAINPGNHREAFEQLIRETSDVSGWINRFLGGCISIAFNKHIGDDLDSVGAVQISLNADHEFEKFSIPYFFEMRDS